MKRAMNPVVVVVVAATMIVAGCMSMTIDEGTAFAPPKPPYANPAKDAAEMQTRWLEQAESAMAKGDIVIAADPAGGTIVRYSPAAKAARPSPDFHRQDGFWIAGAQKIAWSHYRALDAAPGAPLIVHCAGNAGDRYNSSEGYARKGLQFGALIAFDYPGYGDSSGKPRSETLEAIAPVVRAEALAAAKGRPLVFWGHSLGGFICARLAAQTPEAAGLVLETTARDAASVAKAWTPWYASSIVRVSVAPSLAGYDVAADAVKFGGPVLVIGAAKDKVLPVHLARALHATIAAQSKTATYLELPQARHSDVSAQPDLKVRAAPFFAELSKAGQ
jgi:pimeloyl-ACP methyl ester carboxylesterase